MRIQDDTARECEIYSISAADSVMRAAKLKANLCWYSFVAAVGLATAICYGSASLFLLVCCLCALNVWCVSLIRLRLQEAERMAKEAHELSKAIAALRR